MVEPFEFGVRFLGDGEYVRLQIAHRLTSVRPYRVVPVNRQFIVWIKSDQNDAAVRVNTVSLETNLKIVENSWLVKERQRRQVVLSYQYVRIPQRR